MSASQSPDRDEPERDSEWRVSGFKFRSELRIEMSKWKASRTNWMAGDASPGGKASPQAKSACAAANRASSCGGIVIADPSGPLCEQLSREELDAVCLALPKIELHAHLSGSVRESTLKELLLASGGESAYYPGSVAVEYGKAIFQDMHWFCGILLSFQ